MRHKHNQSYTQQAHPLTVIGVAVWRLTVQKIHHTWFTCLRAKASTVAHQSVLCSNKTPPYGRLRARPSKSSMAASHYCPIKAVGAMWAARHHHQLHCLLHFQPAHSDMVDPPQIWINNTTIGNTQTSSTDWITVRDKERWGMDEHLKDKWNQQCTLMYNV